MAENILIKHDGLQVIHRDQNDGGKKVQKQL